MRTKVPPGCDCVVYLIAGAPLKLMGSQKEEKQFLINQKPNNNYWTHLAKCNVCGQNCILMIGREANTLPCDFSKGQKCQSKEIFIGRHICPMGF